MFTIAIDRFIDSIVSSEFIALFMYLCINGGGHLLRKSFKHFPFASFPRRSSLRVDRSWKTSLSPRILFCSSTHRDIQRSHPLHPPRLSSSELALLIPTNINTISTTFKPNENSSPITIKDNLRITCKQLQTT
ncbi:DNA replication licensing factor [Dirofilaria immitis]